MLIKSCNNIEINIVREKLSTAEKVNKVLIELSDMYESNNNMEGVERTTYKMEKLNEEYSDTNQCVQEFLDALREENGSHYSRNSRKRGQSVKSIQSQQSKKIEEVKQQMADFEKEVTEKEQKSLEQEYLSKQKILEKKLQVTENSTKKYINMEADYQHSKRSTKDDDISRRLNQNQEEREDEEGCMQMTLVSCYLEEI